MPGLPWPSTTSQEGYGFGMTEVLVLFLESPLEVAGTINLSSALGKQFNLTFSDLSYFTKPLVVVDISGWKIIHPRSFS